LKRFALLAVVGVGLLALPGGASARSDCAYAGGGPVAVYGPGGGVTGDSIAGVCVDTNTAADGGYLEIGANPSKGTYVPVGVYGVIDGSDANPAGQAQGYGAISTYSSDGTQDDCQIPADPSDNASGTNSGGCLTLRNPTTSAPIVSIPLVPLACGNTTGPDWTNAGRDGCRIP
jgi:hypothetical protein